MKHSRKLLAGLVAVAGGLFLNAPVLAASDDTPDLGEVGGWSISLDSSLGDGCFASSGFEDGSALRFGFSNLDDDLPFYIALIKEDWASIEDGKDYEVTLQFDKAQPWSATATGMHMGDFPGLLVGTDQSDFLTELARKKKVSWWYQDTLLGTYSLSGTFAATQAIAACQQLVEQNGAPAPKSTPDDPFKGGKPKADPKDPFA